MKKRLFNYYSLLSVLILVTFFGIVQTHKAVAQTPSSAYVTPNFNYLAPCPTCTSPSYPVVSGEANPYVSQTQPQTAPVSLTPCENDNSNYEDNKKKKSKHKKHSGAISNAMEKFLEFLIELINLLLKLLGGGQINMPSSGEPVPSVPAALPSAAEAPIISSTVGYPNNPDTDPISTAPQNPCSGSNEPSSGPDYNPGSASPGTSNPSASGAPGPSGAAALPSGYTGPSGAAQNNSIDLTNWKLQLPTGSEGKVDEVKQPELGSYTKDPWYLPNSGGGIRFRASVKGVTTSGSSYPRSELREMKGSTEAAWESASGTHVMTIDEAITAVPKTKKHVVAGQIHDGSSDVIVIRLEMPKLFVDINGQEGPILDANYTLGKKFNVKFEVTGGKTNIYYNGATTPAHTLTKSYSSAYFKAGAYTQSNCTTDPSDCSDNNFGEVVIYNLSVTHQ